MKHLKVSLFIFFVITLTIDSYSQRVNETGNQKEQLVNSKKVAFFTEKIGLTPEESENFWPIYNEYWKKKNIIISERREKMTFFAKNSESLSSSEIEKYADEYISYELEIATLLNEYHIKFKEILPIEKVMKIYVADYEFKAYLLFQIKDSGNKEKD